MMPLIFITGLIGAAMPQIPFDAVDPVLRRTIHVKSSCDTNEHTLILLASDITPLDSQLTAALMHAFATDGITVINVCRTRAR